MAVVDAYAFPGFLTPVLTQQLLFFPKPPTTFPTCFCSVERQKYAEKKSRLNQESNSEPPGHESDTPLSHPGGALPEWSWLTTHTGAKSSMDELHTRTHLSVKSMQNLDSSVNSTWVQSFNVHLL